MPGLDGTGPRAKGSLTGRRRGKCADKSGQEESHSNEKRKEDTDSGFGEHPFARQRRRRRMRGSNE